MRYDDEIEALQERVSKLEELVLRDDPVADTHADEIADAENNHGQVDVTKSSGDGLDAGDWTQAGMDATGFPVPKGSATDVTSQKEGE